MGVAAARRAVLMGPCPGRVATRCPGARRAVIGVMHVAPPSFDPCPYPVFAARCTGGQAARATQNPPEPDTLAAPPTERKAYAPAPPGKPADLGGDDPRAAPDIVQHINYLHLTNAGEPLDVLA